MVWFGVEGFAVFSEIQVFFFFVFFAA